MAVSVNTVETGVPIGPIGTTQQVRNVTATVLINGVATPVLMQVVSLADQNGNLIDINSTKRQDVELQLLVEIRRELMIQNELLSQWMAMTFPNVPGVSLDQEYRRDPVYDYPGI